MRFGAKLKISSFNKQKYCNLQFYGKSNSINYCKVVAEDKQLKTVRNSSSHSNEVKEKFNDFYFHLPCSTKTKEEVSQSFSVKHNFIDEMDEANIVSEVEPHLQRHRYEFDHWDDAIHGYREIERQKWSKECSPILQKVREVAFQDSSNLIPHIHVLDLSIEGVIKAHIDSVKFCGDTIAGLCLLSDVVMRLVHNEQKNQIIDILLPKRSLYIMKNASRYNYTHEVLGKNLSYFGNKLIERGRRISVITRNQPC